LALAYTRCSYWRSGTADGLTDISAIAMSRTRCDAWPRRLRPGEIIVSEQAIKDAGIEVGDWSRAILS